MPNPNPNTDPIKPHQVRTTEEARALAAHREGLPEASKKATVVLFTRQLAALEKQGVKVSPLLRTLIDQYLDGKADKTAWIEAVQAGINARRVQKGERWDAALTNPERPARRIKVVLRDGSAVYFRNYLYEVGSPSPESPDLIINGENEAGAPMRVQAPARELMTIVFE
ncbi:hypothetical protein [Deinococcus multiflagellatus]|uniref:Uncharacterized protein n=1 Tax=Deinococcus multiflagellatus TaxID=1656887 RepID=A0ABW1ZQU9_9DEIO|nr:hypothetical protein [Deinococcus multiflagellatus]MBZ9715389.1 hypothetical protein [Deinococcus multiflagellatus]